MGELTQSERRLLLRLARLSIEAVLNNAEPPDPFAGPAHDPGSPLLEPRGVFVSLHRGERLRGCIGTMLGRQPLLLEVPEQALHAAFDDPRFPPVLVSELPDLEIEITILTRSRPVSSPEQIEVGRHGVVIERGERRAVFLPQVAIEQGWDRPALLRHLCRKAGLPPDSWRDGGKLEVFEGTVLREAGS
jgi:AmmeMemoRadiSam system protein A